MADRFRRFSATPSAIAPSKQAPVSIDELGLPARITVSLKGAGIESVEDLLKKDELELRAIRGLGTWSLEQVNASLRDGGFIKE
jgi:DNA-directed RNA polymerase alpha subunit